MKKISFSCLIFTAVFFLYGFKFNGKATFPPPGISELITHEVWTSAEFWTDSDGDGVFSMVADSCMNDNHWLFDSTGHLLITEELIACNPDVPEMDSVHLNWQLDNSQSFLQLNFGNNTEVVDFQVYAIGLQVLELHFVDEENPLAPVKNKLILKR